jgi:hypothetical protein
MCPQPTNNERHEQFGSGSDIDRSQGQPGRAHACSCGRPQNVSGSSATTYTQILSKLRPQPHEVFNRARRDRAGAADVSMLVAAATADRPPGMEPA